MRSIPIVLGSVLKPVDDTRMYEKLGITLAETNNYEINIIGFSSKNNPTFKNINFYPLFDFNRLNHKRILAPWKFLRLLIKLKPELTIVNTHELLIVTVLYKILFGKKIVYDIIENYYRNIRFNNYYDPVIKRLLAVCVRLKEIILSPFFNYIILAEKGYVRELSFIKKNYIVIENKYKEIHTATPLSRNDNRIRILFNGTISADYGIFSIIRFMDRLYDYDQAIEFLIIGHCAYRQDLVRLEKEIQSRPYITFIGGDAPVPHHDIIDAVRNADFGIINYKINKSTENCIPTRIYEYIGNRLPILIQDYKPWHSIPGQFNGCLIVDFENPDPAAILSSMQTTDFYSKNITNNIYWENEELKLIETVQTILGSS